MYDIISCQVQNDDPSLRIWARIMQKIQQYQTNRFNHELESNDLVKIEPTQVSQTKDLHHSTAQLN